MNIIPLELRPHLIPFLYKELEGTEYQYLKEKVKACKIDTRSTLGFILATTLVKVGYPVKPSSKYYIYLSLDISESVAKIYKIENYEDTFLMVPEEVKENINDIIEDHFRIAFQFHSRGMLRANPLLEKQQVVAEFMTEYEMDEYGFDLNSMVRLLQRGRIHKISRIQNQTPSTLRSKSVSDK
jgi:hypothetical protein